VLDTTGIDNVDYTAAKMLLQTRSELVRRGVTVASVAVSSDVIAELRRYGLGGDGGESRIFSTVAAAVAALSPSR
jgi:MFS superfamily sulfate permease-like transporter